MTHQDPLRPDRPSRRIINAYEEVIARDPPDFNTSIARQNILMRRPRVTQVPGWPDVIQGRSFGTVGSENRTPIGNYSDGCRSSTGFSRQVI